MLDSSLRALESEIHVLGGAQKDTSFSNTFDAPLFIEVTRVKTKLRRVKQICSNLQVITQTLKGRLGKKKMGEYKQTCGKSNASRIWLIICTHKTAVEHKPN